MTVFAAAAMLTGCGSTLKPSTDAQAPVVSTASASGSAIVPEVRVIEGIVEAIPPATAVGTFKVAGQTVSVNSSTLYTSGTAAAALNWVVVGAKVHVTATVTTTASVTTVLATVVDVLEPATVTLAGAISNFTGTATSFTFDLAGAHVTGSATTVFEGDGTFADLKNGASVEVTANVRTDGVFATKLEVAVEEDSTDGEGDGGGEGEGGHSAEVKPLVGDISGFHGTASSFNFDIEGKHVTGGAGTEFQAQTTFADLKDGVKAQVWTETRSGALFATKIHKTGKK